MEFDLFSVNKGSNSIGQMKIVFYLIGNNSNEIKSNHAISCIYTLWINISRKKIDFIKLDL